MDESIRRNKDKLEQVIFEWMKKKGFDRKASKDIAPIIVEYLGERHIQANEKRDLLIGFVKDWYKKNPFVSEEKQAKMVDEYLSINP